MPFCKNMSLLIDIIYTYVYYSPLLNRGTIFIIKVCLVEITVPVSNKETIVVVIPAYVVTHIIHNYLQFCSSSVPIVLTNDYSASFIFYDSNKAAVT